VSADDPVRHVSSRVATDHVVYIGRVEHFQRVVLSFPTAMTDKKAISGISLDEIDLRAENLLTTIFRILLVPPDDRVDEWRSPHQRIVRTRTECWTSATHLPRMQNQHTDDIDGNAAVPRTDQNPGSLQHLVKPFLREPPLVLDPLVPQPTRFRSGTGDKAQSRLFAQSLESRIVIPESEPFLVKVVWNFGQDEDGSVRVFGGRIGWSVSLNAVSEEKVVVIWIAVGPDQVFWDHREKFPELDRKVVGEWRFAMIVYL
jgi:hypothetical protein